MPQEPSPFDPHPGSRPSWAIWDRLRKAREESGHTQEEFAERSTISLRTISNYEKRGYTGHKKGTVYLWSIATGYSFQWLMNGDIDLTDPTPTDQDVQQTTWYADAPTATVTALHPKRSNDPSRPLAA